MHINQLNCKIAKTASMIKMMINLMIMCVIIVKIVNKNNVKFNNQSKTKPKSNGTEIKHCKRKIGSKTESSKKNRNENTIFQENIKQRLYSEHKAWKDVYEDDNTYIPYESQTARLSLSDGNFYIAHSSFTGLNSSSDGGALYC